MKKFLTVHYHGKILHGFNSDWLRFPLNDWARNLLDTFLSMIFDVFCSFHPRLIKTCIEITESFFENKCSPFLGFICPRSLYRWKLISEILFPEGSEYYEDLWSCRYETPRSNMSADTYYTKFIRGSGRKLQVAFFIKGMKHELKKKDGLPRRMSIKDNGVLKPFRVVVQRSD